MKRRKWDASTKAMIVLQGLKGKPVAGLCTEHQISQSLYYQWRDQFLANAANAFEMSSPTHKEIHLEQENTRLKKLVGELLLELKENVRRLA
jgi:transposase